ncbi:hypothetical protein N9878_01255 [bacterium]|nr:hypothetical protein [bacterium]
MNDLTPNEIDEDLIGRVKGGLLARMIRAILWNRWDTGRGLISSKGASGGMIELDTSFIEETINTPVVARVTEDSTFESDIVYIKAIEQAWIEADGTFGDMVDGRVWDGESASLARIVAVDGQTRTIDQLVTIEPRYDLGEEVWYVVPEMRQFFRARISSSSSASTSHGIVEIDGSGDDVVGGRTDAGAKAMNGRTGVPLTTQVFVVDIGPSAEDGDPRYWFTVGEGLSTDPYTLTTETAVGASIYEWDVTDQADKEGAEFDPARVALSVPAIWFYSRPMTVDGSGDVILVGPEGDDVASREYYISGAGADSAKDGHITLISSTSGLANGKDVKLNKPQGLASTASIILASGTNVDDISGQSTVQMDLTFDDSGRYRDGNQSQTFTINVAAGGGAADGQGYEDVEVNGVSVLAITDAGVINFKDKATVSAGHAQVQFNGTNATPEVTVEAEVDIDAYLKTLGDYAASPTVKQVLVNDNGTIKWVDTAECP